MSATLIVGIGTTGLEIIEQAQQFHYEYTGKNRPGSNVEYIYVETNENRNPKKTASGTTDIISVKVPLDGAVATLNRMKENNEIDSKWAPDPTQIVLAGVGAGGAPSYGRLSIWDSAHYIAFRETVISAFQRLNQETRVLIVGTLTGGTGSVLCIDITYIINEIVSGGSSGKTNGIFLIPDQESGGSDKALFENSFSAMAAINKYENTAKYNTKFLDGRNVVGNCPPFEFVQYLSPEFNDSRPSISKGDLVRVAGIITALNILETDKPENQNKHFASLLLERRIDSKTNDKIKNSITSGFVMIQYPKYQLQELLAIKLSRDILNGLLDSRNFEDNNRNKKPIETEKVNLKKQVQEYFESILKKGYLHLDGVNVSTGLSIIDSLKSDCEALIKKNHGMPSNSSFIFNQFKTNTSGNYFDLLSSNKILIRDKWIEEIYEYIAEITKSYKNINITGFTLDSIVESITSIIKFYKDEYTINGQDNSWDRLLKSQLTKLESNISTDSMLLNRRASYLYSLNSLCELCKIHNGISILEQIRDDIQTGDMGLRSTSNKELPNKRKIAQIEEIINNVSNGIGNTNSSSYTLNLRESELNQMLTSNNSCFKILYANKSKDEDLEFAYNNYKRSIETRLSANEMFGTVDLWKYLTSNSSDIYTTCLKNSNDFVRQNKFLVQTDLFQIINSIENDSINRDIKELFNKEKSRIKSDYLPPLVRLNTDRDRFEEDSCAKLIFISNNHNDINNKLLNNNTYKLDPGIAGSNAVDISSLNDTIIIYQEYGYMGEFNGIKQNFSPLKHLIYMDQTKSHLRSVSNDTFILKKVPYLSKSEFNKYIEC